MTNRDEVDAAIETYKRELTAEAALARGDLDEIEDHFRALVDELRAHQPLGEAIAAAKLRIGEPRALAREHARVHGSFGPQLARWRAWSVLVLLVPIIGAGLAMMPAASLWSRFGAELAGALVIVLGLAARRGWARPVLFAGAAFWTIPAALSLYQYPQQSPLWLLAHLGIVAFLAPWRGREITRAGVALAFQTWTFTAATFVLGYQITTRHGGYEYVTPSAQVAFFAAAIAVAGGLVRARWSAIGSLLACGSLVVSVEELVHLNFRIGDAYTVLTFGALATGILTSAIAGVLLWRHARSTFGSLRDALAA